MSRNVQKLMNKGALHIARERGLVQEAYKKPEFILDGESLLPVAGEVVLVQGLPVTKTGRILRSVTDIRDCKDKDNFDVLFAYQIEKLKEIETQEYQRTRGRNLEMPCPILKAKEINPDLSSPRKSRVIYKRKTYPIWSLT